MGAEAVSPGARTDPAQKASPEADEARLLQGRRLQGIVLLPIMLLQSVGALPDGRKGDFGEYLVPIPG